MKYLLGSLAALFTASCGSHTAEEWRTTAQAVVYGDDDRVEVSEIDDVEFASFVRHHVGALIPSAFLVPTSDGDYEIVAATLAERGICAGERFSDQLAAAACTALLVTPNRILTAGHCFAFQEALDLVFVSGYWMGDRYPRLSRSSVHGIDEVVLRVDRSLEEDPGADYAVATLAEPIGEGASIEFAAHLPSVGEPVVVVGTSEGLPLKVDAGGEVLGLLEPDAFSLTSDTFGGSSGSPVFTRRRALAGMLVGGGVDYEFDVERGCEKRRKVADAAGSAEIAVASPRLEAALGESFRSKGTSCSVRRSEDPWTCVGALAALAASLARRWRARRAGGDEDSWTSPKRPESQASSIAG
jgi:hypothetical protein